jgi:ketosteroid isomerase-like protein
LLLVLYISLPGQAQKSNNDSDAKAIAAIQSVLDVQARAWNQGDIAGYMDGYLRADYIIFISGDNLTRGWQTVHDRYKKNYDSREKMGTLSFTGVEISVVSDDMAVVIGNWQLKRANDQPRGKFTLIFRRTKDGWRIVHDHTSSAG